MNNLLMGLMGHAELLVDAPDSSDAVRGRAQSILAQARELRDQIQRLDDITRPHKGDADA